MSEPLKPRIDFEPSSQTVAQTNLKAGQTFTTQEADSFYSIVPELAPIDEKGQVESIVNAALKPRRSVWRKMVMVGVAIFGVSLIAQAVQWVYLSWQQQDWIALGATIAGGLIIFAGIGSLMTEWRRIYHLRQRAEERDMARELLLSHGLGQGRIFCEKLARQAGLEHKHPAFQRWQAALHETHNDREVVQLYAKLVQPVLDNQARNEIKRYAAESALMIAISPLALVDMAFIAWRNIRLINRIATLYGIHLGYFSRIKLFRLVLLNMAFAGASELVREMGVDWLSQDLAARLSARAAQGIGAGLLTARLGIKAMELCRPLPWLKDDKPQLGDFRRQLIKQLKNTLPEKNKSA